MEDYLDNEKVLVQKYEMLLYENKAIYFDIDDFQLIAYHYLAAGELDKAMDVAMRAERCFPESSETRMLRAMVLLDSREINKAFALLEQLEQKDPLNPIINMLKGRVYMEKARVGEAIRQFETSLQKESDDGEIYLRINIADILMRHGESDAALKFLAKALDAELEPSFKAEIYYLAANCYDNQNKLAQAEEMYEKSLDEEPFCDYAWLALGLLLERQERDDEALEAYNFALTINEKLEPAVLGKANLLMFAERYHEAIDTLTGYTDPQSYSEYVLSYLGECYEGLGDSSTAVKYFSKALEIEHNLPDAYWGIGKIMRKQGDYENALRTIDYALLLDPENPDYLFSKGEILLEIGSVTAALATFQEAARLYPTDIEILSMISIILENIYPDIPADEPNNCAEFPDDLLTMLRLALLYYRTGDIRRCQDLLWEIELVDPACRDKFFEILPEALNDDELTGLPPLPF